MSLPLNFSNIEKLSQAGAVWPLHFFDSTYMFKLQTTESNLARHCHFTGFTELDSIHKRISP